MRLATYPSIVKKQTYFSSWLMHDMNVIQRFSRPIPPFQTGVKSFEIPLQPQLFSIDSFIIHKYLKLLENLIVFGIIKKVYKNKGSETAFFLQFLTVSVLN